MRNYILRRLLLLIFVLFGVTLITFILMHVVPGDPALIILDKLSSNTELLLKLRHKLGLDKPLIVQYWEFLKNLVRFNLGDSITLHASVRELIFERFPLTLKLALFSLTIALLIGIPSGVISAVKQYSTIDTFFTIFALFGVSIPVFWLELLLQILFALKLGFFNVSGYMSVKDLFLPSLALGLIYSASITRFTRSSILEVLHMDYVRTARAKGLSEKTVITRHVFRNALIPVVTLVGMQFGGLLTGAAITETVFDLPGLGKLLLDAQLNRDYPLIQGGIIFVAIIFGLSNLSVDIFYAFLDPRIRYD